MYLSVISLIQSCSSTIVIDIAVIIITSVAVNSKKIIIVVIFSSIISRGIYFIFDIFLLFFFIEDAMITTILEVHTYGFSEGKNVHYVGEIAWYDQKGQYDEGGEFTRTEVN